MSSQSIQAHDGIPNAVARDFRGLLERYLPDWSVDGEYNYRASASTQRAAVQLETIMHSGSHPWINDALNNLLNGFEQKVAPDVRSERLAQLVNYIHESQNLDNLNPNGKTGGYVAFTSRSDPYWLDFQANNPEFELR